ncbi:MAG: class I SAM-dependent methyltransferase [Chromatocurvus sp.]
MNTTCCPLCSQAQNTQLFARDGRRVYRRCQRCLLVWVPPAFFLSSAREKAEYDLHENSMADAGYRRFLARLADPLLNCLEPGARGLDFGCGPGPALAAMLEERGCRVALYDVFYQPDQDALQGRYDFITATEVVEHLHCPGDELAGLWSLLRPGGVLGIMTKRVSDREAFLRWHYKNDPTHVCFFSAETFDWWARQYGARLHFPGPDTVLLFKSP